MAVKFINICDKCGIREESDKMWSSRITPISIKTGFIQLCSRCEKEYLSILEQNERRIKDWLGGKE